MMPTPLIRTSSQAVVRIADPEGSRLVICRENGSPLVTIDCEGSVTYGEGYDPDEAARIFWDALARSPYIPHGLHGVGCGHALA